MRKQGKRKRIAWFFLVIFSVDLLSPVCSYALTSGPEQPEMATFQPAGVSGMVDLFTGDFKYNIPLLEVGGYPLNLSYNAGTGLEDEAGWVGAGWTFNPGAVNRTVRGLPDDFNGYKGDRILKEQKSKEFTKVGGEIILKPSILAWEKGFASIKVNVYKDNYYGMGASVGAGVDFNLAKNRKTGLTAGFELDLNSDVRGGVNVQPTFTIERSTVKQGEKFNYKAGLSGSLLYNTRGGLKSTTLGGSFTGSIKKVSLEVSSSAEKYFGQTYTPSINTNTKSNGYTLSFDLGPSIFGGYVGIGGSGYYYKESNVEPSVSVPAFGYLNYTAGRNDLNNLLDFNREKDGVFIPGTPAIAVPVSTHDQLNITSQMGSKQYRPYSGGNYIVFDNQHGNTTSQTTLGVTVGGGNVFKGGGRISNTSGGSSTHKWVDDNQFSATTEPTFGSTPQEEAVAFRPVGELTRADQNKSTYLSRIGNYDTRNVVLDEEAAQASLRSKINTVQVNGQIKKTARESRTSTLSYLSGDMAAKYGLDKTINGEMRVNSNRKPHHISELTVTDELGQRMVYGIPVYNTLQQEMSFSVQPGRNPSDQLLRSGLISYDNNDASTANSKGRMNFFDRETTPAYASSYLLTGVLSPDYVDRTGDGITEDDMGTAVKFKYNKLSSEYKWRTPYGQNKASFNEGFLSDPLDDKASVAYGSKEVWYLSEIRSKTMIAIFETSDREDALGVTGPEGAMNANLKLKKLDRIKLYSKADYVKNGAAAVPIKVVHFEYDYSLYPGMPNNSGASVLNADQSVNLNAAKGKLTLKKVYFTFGESLRGKSNPYEFAYDLRPVNDGTEAGLPLPASGNDYFNRERQDSYVERQSDRWGFYKQSWYNQFMGAAGSSDPLNNSEFPYALQKNAAPDGVNTEKWAALIDRMAGKWQLNQVTTPAGSIINITYESDDYAFVQDRRAMQMCFVKGIQQLPASGSTTMEGLATSNLLIIGLPVPLSGSGENEKRLDFRNKYLKQADGTMLSNIFYKFRVDIDNKGKYEYVYGYAEISNAITDISIINNGADVGIKLKPVDGYNPIARSSWQMLKTSLPQYAYDNYDNLNVGGDMQSAIRSLVSSFSNFGELVRPFEEKAMKKKFANKVDLQRSMVRLLTPDYRKTGGGSRVREIIITDQWAAMANGKTARYGQRYQYTVTRNGVEISSGVASYEPPIGNEENPFHEPVPFTEKVRWGSDKYHFVEMPFCESYFPAATVGYSRVEVIDLGEKDVASGNPARQTGYIVNEFYTAKDFPTIVDFMPLETSRFENSMILKLFTSTYKNRIATSQGFKVELNDMHGKPSAVRTYNKAGDNIAYTEYEYKVRDQQAVTKELNNQVDVMEKDGAVSHNVDIGTEVDFITDVRESTNNTTGFNVGTYVGGMVVPFPFVSYIPYAAVNTNVSFFHETFRSVAVVKVINRFGIASKTRTMQNGSVLEAENLVWDGETGSVVLSRVQNEFEKYTYSFNYPAHLAYEGMDGAYKNQGMVININFTAGNIQPYSGTLVPGDELVNLETIARAWVIRSADNLLRLIDNTGQLVTMAGNYQVIRSGRRNLLAAGVGTVVTMSDPRVNGRIDLGVNRRILESSAVIYKDEWGIPVNKRCATCPAGYTLSADETTCTKVEEPAYVTSYTVCAGVRLIDYGPCGTALYGSFSAVGPFSRIYMPYSSEVWNGTERSSLCATAPPTTGATVTLPPATLRMASGDTVTNNISLRSSDDGKRGPLNRCGIWTCSADQANPLPQFTWVGFSKTINFPTTKYYYIGLASDNMFRLKVDGQLRFQLYDNAFQLWHILPIKLDAGPHVIEMENYNVGGYGTMGMEVYNNTSTELEAATSETQLNRLFNTRELVGQTFGSYSCLSGGTLNTSTVPFTCRLEVTPTYSQPNNPAEMINPYYTGVKGNWRPWISYVYTVDRTVQTGNTSIAGRTDIRNSGYYSTYNPFWNFGVNGLSNTIPSNSTTYQPADTRWVWNSQSVLFDQKGNETENVDPLNRYGAALFGYENALSTAVASNARKNEIAFDGFEDYDFLLETTSSQTCPIDKHFNFGFVRASNEWVSPSGKIVSTAAHSGKYSYQLNSAVSLTMPAGSGAPATAILGFDASGRYKLLSNQAAAGFGPVPGKKYLLSFWVKDNATNSASNKVENLSVSINGVDQQVSTMVVPVVEGWKRVELTFTAQAAFSLQLSPSGTMLMDDFRISPFDSHLQSFVYDDVNLRLKAQLDENNFATFYEYDEEGTLVRTKKETDRGIMTINESRQYFRNH
ncbi:MAG: hypothetical protein P0Y53_16415 [Candidatus Pseudobacter hemicellulosilyticus]|uniref:PA14 domain-containing protein n=1 Tax=Candidatus Pseudobacter hemicellulosilyticus TaxID=3121375 RepID=A0AAJ6BFA6_9BACT|nr:MAG: hypothetical protein P0Y53_16415 [Pseudobacter sp.]